jgi:hypothetical protein
MSGLRVCAAAFVMTALASATALAQAPMEKGRAGLALDQITTKWTGDLSGMAERRR